MTYEELYFGFYRRVRDSAQSPHQVGAVYRLPMGASENYEPWVPQAGDWVMHNGDEVPNEPLMLLAPLRGAEGFWSVRTPNPVNLANVNLLSRPDNRTPYWVPVQGRLPGPIGPGGSGSGDPGGPGAIPVQDCPDYCVWEDI